MHFIFMYKPFSTSPFILLPFDFCFLDNNQAGRILDTYQISFLHPYVKIANVLTTLGSKRVSSGGEMVKGEEW